MLGIVNANESLVKLHPIHLCMYCTLLIATNYVYTYIRILLFPCTAKCTFNSHYLQLPLVGQLHVHAVVCTCTQNILLFINHIINSV